jgi:hypothetical protein
MEILGHLSCPAQAGHPVIAKLSMLLGDYWIVRLRGR